MSNFDDFFPPPSPVGNFSFVANGAIAAGKTCILDPAGTVKEVIGDLFSTGSGAQIVNGVTQDYASVYDPDTLRIVVVYQDDLNTQISCVVGVVTTGPDAIAFGTPVIVGAGGGNDKTPDICYDTLNNRIVIFWEDASNDIQSVVGTVTTGPDTITFGSTVLVHAGTAEHPICTFDDTNDKIIVVYQDTVVANDPILGNVGTVSTGPDSISFGAQQTVTTNTPAVGARPTIKYDPDSNNILMSWKDPSSDSIVGVLTVSGTTLSTVQGSTVIFTGSINESTIAYNSSENALCVLFATSTSVLRANGMTISGTTITAGTGANVTITGMATGNPFRADFDSVNEKICVIQRSTEDPVLVTLNMTGTAISWDTDVNILFSGTNLGDGVSITYEPVAKKVACFYGDGTDTTEQSVIATVPFTNLTATDLVIGISEQTAADTENLFITIPGGVNLLQSGLTPAQEYWVDTDGSLQPADTGFQQIGTALSPTDFLLVEEWFV